MKLGAASAAANKKVVIIGGGLAGLSAGFHLQEHEPLVFEKEKTVGGLCRSFQQDGFTFDVTGHLIHLKNPYTRELIEKLLPGQLDHHERQAAIYSKTRVTPYPFQANTYGLPPEVVKECVVGFVETLVHKNGSTPNNFYDWSLQTFGAGIAKHFMLPFNEKFWRTDLREITADWVSWSIPKPTLEQVVNGALGLTNSGMGYNPKFQYPKRGGIDCLPLGLAKPLKKVETEYTLELIDAEKRFVRFANGREESFDYLISTIPLPLTYALLKGAPDKLKDAANRLRVISVLNLNVGVDRAKISDKHWLYFPEDEFVFSRVGFPANFSPNVAPAGASSMYIEITHRPNEKLSVEEMFERSMKDLQKCGVVAKDDKVLTLNVIDINYAYVVFDELRQAHINPLIEYLESRSIFPAGRFGCWDYYSMEDSILSGKKAADAIAAKICS